LKVIPNTELARAMTERGIELDGISSSYMVVAPRWANLMLYVLCVWRPPRWLWHLMLKPVKACREPQREYPRLNVALRLAYLGKRAVGHMKHADFTVLPGKTGYYLWRLGVVGFLRKNFTKYPPKPVKEKHKPVDVANRIPLS